MTVIELSERQVERDASGLGGYCAACGHIPADGNPLVISDDGMRIHLDHFLDPSTGFYGEPFAEAES